MSTVTVSLWLCMPAVSLCKHRLWGAFAYARRLQELCCHVLGLRLLESDELDLDIELHSEPEVYNIAQANSDASSLSSHSFLSSLSSLSSFSSLSLINEDPEIPLPLADMQDVLSNSEYDLELEEDFLYLTRLQAVRAWIHYLKTTHVLHPNNVHKLSQLHLVLVAYKDEDPKRFWHNLYASPETFDALYAKIKSHPIFQNASPNEQLPVDQQLAIALFRFGHFGNDASVESVAQ